MTPRVLATLIVLPLLVAFGNCAGLLGGFLVAVITPHISPSQFWTRAINALVLGDLWIGFTKPVVFAFILATVRCYQGLRVKGGTEGVGRATITTFVESSLIILVVDLFLTKLLLYVFNL